MNLTATLLLSFVGALPVEATTLDGAAVSGELSALTAQSATIVTEGTAAELPVAKLHLLRLHEIGPLATGTDGGDFEGQLAHGRRAGRTFGTNGGARDEVVRPG